MSDEISVCLSCYQAVIQLRRGASDFIYKAKCRCGRVFVLDLKIKKKEELNENENYREDPPSFLQSYICFKGQKRPLKHTEIRKSLVEKINGPDKKQG